MRPSVITTMLIDERYFTHPDTYVAGIETKSDGKPAGNAPKIISDIRAYTELYEPIFLQMLLGTDVAANIKEQPELLNMLVQPEKGTSVIAKYIYFYYSRDHMTFNTIAGEKLKNTENSSRTTQSPRLVRLWNNMVEECRYIINNTAVDICPDPNGEIFEKINIFNL